MLNSFNFSLQECECGVSINFANPSGSLPKKDEYFLDFNVESSLPLDIPSTITLSPQSYLMSGSNSFIPKVITKVQSIHRGETQSLIRLSIKDRFNKSLYTDYVKVVCSPTSVVSLFGQIKYITDDLGPNGFDIMTVNTTTRDLDIGMSVTGANITQPTFIKTILSDTQLELSRSFAFPEAQQSFQYTFTRVTSCIDPDLVKLRESQSQYVVLNQKNNWTYVSSDKMIIQFIRENQQDNSISIIIPAKNTNTLPDSLDKSDIPATSMIYTIGRVNNDQYCIS
jgi:hypothetical protein